MAGLVLASILFELLRSSADRAHREKMDAIMDTHDTACIDDRVVDASPDAPLQPAKSIAERAIIYDEATVAILDIGKTS